MQLRNCLALLIVGISVFGVSSLHTEAAGFTARGSVFNDVNGNGVRDDGERGVKNVLVSNQREIAKTNSRGEWELPLRDDCIFFVIKPEGWATPVNHHNLPQFYYIHKPAGSPISKYAGVAPTGPLPKSINFPLHRQKEPDEFKAIFFGDPQPRDQKEIDYISRDVVEELIGTDSEFGVTLGDIMFDDLSLFESNNALIALIGVPWYNIIGNHDMNYDAVNDTFSDETYERYYGPSYFAWNHGPVTFIGLDNVVWGGKKPEGSGSYTAGLGTEQLRFVENLMPHIPKNRLIVLMMHIPLFNTKDKEKLFRLIEDRPYTFSISGHTHWHANRFLGEDEGWHGKEPHHHVVNVTVSGSWWSGEPDEFGIPHTMMRDGAPNGYTILNFDGEKVVVDYKVARRPANYQMSVFAPTIVNSGTASESFVYVNVFNGSERSTVRMRIGRGGEWIKLDKSFEEDRYYLALKEFEKANPEKLTNRTLSNVIKSEHLWKAAIPGGLPPGEHLISVQTEDMYGRVFHASRSLRVK